MNQLMAVAARGIKRETFEERRYHHSSMGDAAKIINSEDKTSTPRIEDNKGHSEPNSTDCTEITAPARVLSKQPKMAENSRKQGNTDEQVVEAPQKTYFGNFLNGSSSGINKDAEKEDAVHRNLPDTLKHPGNTSRPLLKSSLPNQTGNSPSDGVSKTWLQNLFRRGERKENTNGRTIPAVAKVKRSGAKKGRNAHDGDEEEDDEIGIHMWENRGNLAMEIPWFVKNSEA